MEKMMLWLVNHLLTLNLVLVILPSVSIAHPKVIKIVGKHVKRNVRFRDRV